MRVIHAAKLQKGNRIVQFDGSEPERVVRVRPRGKDELNVTVETVKGTPRVGRPYFPDEKVAIL